MIQPSGALEHAKRLRELAQSVAGQPKEPDYYGEFNKAAITIEELAEQLAAARAAVEKADTQWEPHNCRDVHPAYFKAALEILQKGGG